MGVRVEACGTPAILYARWLVYGLLGVLYSIVCGLLMRLGYVCILIGMRVWSLCYTSYCVCRVVGDYVNFRVFIG